MDRLTHDYATLTWLWLTTSATPFPVGIPFAMAGPHFVNGWRIMYVIGALLAGAPSAYARVAARGRLAETDRIVSDMEGGQRLVGLARTRTGAPCGSSPTGHSLRGNLGRSPLSKSYVVVASHVVFQLRHGVFVCCRIYQFIGLVDNPVPEAGLIAAVGTVGMILKERLHIFGVNTLSGNSGC